MKTFNTIAVETDIKGIDSNQELAVLFARALEVCQTAKATEVINLPPSSSTQYLSFPNVTYCVQHTESINLKAIPLPEEDFNGCIDSVQAFCSKMKLEKENYGKHNKIEVKNEPSQLYEEVVRDGGVTKGNKASPELFEICNENSESKDDSELNEDNSKQNSTFNKVNSTYDKDIEVAQDSLEQTIVLKENDTAQNPVNKHPPKTQYICPYCDKSFNSGASLKIHIFNHTKARRFQCDLCGKVVASAASLKVHTRRHLGDKPFKCSHCDKAFVTKPELKEHRVLHTGEKAYKCRICDRAYTRKGKLDQHFRIHTGEKPYNCEHCQVAFISKENLSKHLRKHSKERPHQCDHCKKTFMMKHDLGRHLLIHGGERPYKCDICNKGFIRKDRMLLHMQSCFLKL